MRKTLIGVLILLVTLPAYTQLALLKGKVTDTVEKKDLQYATVNILTRADSILVNFTRTKADGSFELQDIPAGEYLILICYPKYADYAEEFTVSSSNKLKDLNTIALIPVSKLLENVIVHSRGAIRIKGDTTEFIADSFKVREGANVEELLRKLPGLTVNSKGEITAQGKRVDKVLVDGEEFFGDDPTMATQNLAAKAVDKVQVYDTKTEQQQLTGITTGNEGKTVNIQLKEDAKKGFFGKAEASSNFDKLHDGKLLFNRFTGKKKFSVFGIKSNTNTGNLNWQEQRQIGQENDFEYDELSGYFYSYSEADEFSDWSLRGLPDAYSAGSLFIDKWNRDKQSVNLSYKYNRLGAYNESTTLNQTLLKDTTYYNNSRGISDGLNQQHAVMAKYEWKIDSLSSIKYTGRGIYKSNESVRTTLSEALNASRDTVNTGNRVNTTDAETRKMDNTLTYRQLFKKKGRQFIATLRYGIDDLTSDGNLLAVNDFYKNGLPDSTSRIDQLKQNKGHSETYGGKLTFSEPLNNKWSLITEYSYYRNKAKANNNTFEKDVNDKYTIINPVFSSNFDLSASSHTGNAIFRYIYKKVNLSMGSSLSAVELNLLNKDNNQPSHYNFLNITPQFTGRYELKAQTNVYLSYRGSTRQPTINQLQPLRDNSDPLNVYEGNPDLKVGFQHNFNFGYNSFKILSQRYMSVGGSFNVTDNAITTTSTVDQFGKRTYKSVNVNGNYNWFLYGNMFKQGAENKLNLEFGINANGGRNINFINGNRNENNFATASVRMGLGMYKEEKYSFNINPTLGKNFSKSSLRQDVNNNYWLYGGEVRGTIYLPWKLEISSDAEFNLRQKINAFDDNVNIIVWNATLRRSFFKKKNGKIFFTAHDMLNQNKGFNRTINSTFVNEERFLRLSRYFMLGFEWSFTRNPGQK